MSAKAEKPETSADAGADSLAWLELAANETCRTLRRTAEDGADELHGVFRVRFEFGDDRASLFVPFCPAFDFDPSIEFEQVGGPDGSVKLAGCFPHGMRLDVKREESAMEEDRVADAEDDTISDESADDVVLQVFARAECPK